MHAKPLVVGACTFKGLTHAQLKLKRIDDFQKRELIEIGVPGTDLPDAMLAHENCGVSIVNQIADDVWQLENDFAGDVGMTMGRDENGEAW